MATQGLIIQLDDTGHGFRVITASGHGINLPPNAFGARFIYELLMEQASNTGSTLNLPSAPSQAAASGVLKIWTHGTNRQKELPLHAVLGIWMEQDKHISKQIPVKQKRVRKFDERGREMMTLADLGLD